LLLWCLGRGCILTVLKVTITASAITCLLLLLDVSCIWHNSAVSLCNVWDWIRIRLVTYAFYFQWYIRLSLRLRLTYQRFIGITGMALINYILRWWLTSISLFSVIQIAAHILFTTIVVVKVRNHIKWWGMTLLLLLLLLNLLYIFAVFSGKRWWHLKVLLRLIDGCCCSEYEAIHIFVSVVWLHIESLTLVSVSWCYLRHLINSYILIKEFNLRYLHYVLLLDYFWL
jgi:hypothetical protein